MHLAQLQQELIQLANPQQQAILQRFFKTGVGEYGAGDVFLGIKVPVQRQLAKKYQNLPLSDIETLLQSHYHEYRFTALILLTTRYLKSDESTKIAIFNSYLKHIDSVNHWDLVDLSAPAIIGQHLLDKPRWLLYQLVQTDHLWHKRIAMVATLTFIKQGEFAETLQLAEHLLHEQHGLLHKASGWMLREVGKRDTVVLENFLQRFHHAMPRTMLRYAIEKFDEQRRNFYLNRQR